MWYISLIVGFTLTRLIIFLHFTDDESRSFDQEFIIFGPLQCPYFGKYYFACCSQSLHFYLFIFIYYYFLFPNSHCLMTVLTQWIYLLVTPRGINTIRCCVFSSITTSILRAHLHSGIHFPLIPHSFFLGMITISRLGIIHLTFSFYC